MIGAAPLVTSAPASVPLLQMRGICKRFPGVKALDAVDFDLQRGEVHVLLGENGAGKSTLMHVLSGACVRDSGEILFDGQSVPLRSPREAQARGISTIYQELNLVPHLSAAANIFLGREPSRMPGVIDRARLTRDAAALLASLGTRIDPNASVSDLSVAEQQMVEVAKALSLDARVLIMDEPTSALTESEIDQLFAAIAGLTARGVSVIYISHRLEEVSRVGHRATVMRDGRQVATLAASRADRRARAADGRPRRRRAFPGAGRARGAPSCCASSASRAGRAFATSA